MKMLTKKMRKLTVSITLVVLNSILLIFLGYKIYAKDTMSTDLKLILDVIPASKEKTLKIVTSAIDYQINMKAAKMLICKYNIIKTLLKDPMQIKEYIKTTGLCPYIVQKILGEKLASLYDNLTWNENLWKPFFKQSTNILKFRHELILKQINIIIKESKKIIVPKMDPVTKEVPFDSEKQDKTQQINDDENEWPEDEDTEEIEFPQKEINVEIKQEITQKPSIPVPPIATELIVPKKPITVAPVITEPVVIKETKEELETPKEKSISMEIEESPSDEVNTELVTTTTE